MKLLVLYEELAGYFLSCVNKFSSQNGAEVYVFSKEINKEAPFEFKHTPFVFFYNQSDSTCEQIIAFAEDHKVDAIFCGGWINKKYLRVCKKYRKEIPVILGFDNKWENTLKQNIASVFNSFVVKNYFNSCWVPGKKQFQFAKRLGFSKEEIQMGAYSADYNFFHAIYLALREKKKNKFPHRFIFAGRYYEFKGIKDLWQAFSEVTAEFPNDWELWCFGTGDIPQIKHPKIKHFGFIQPQDMGKYISETGVFILASHFEPWGVVVHEFAAAGFPLVCSDEVGANETFLSQNENGLVFKSKDVAGLKSAIKKIISMPDENLFQMGERSAELASQITPEKWAVTLLSIIQHYSNSK
ncbi:MAG: glycosyltransferase family 4 protein [Bacteroidetes bacterium]|nr:glycosyltransferase family 4 protein [Bacteroidota bacterium]